MPDEGLAVQANYQMSDGETIEREVKALVALHGLYPLKRAMIITYEGLYATMNRWRIDP